MCYFLEQPLLSVRSVGFSVNNLILSGFLAIGDPVGVALPDRDAPKYIAKALYREYDLNVVVKRLEKRHLKKEWRKYGGYIGLSIRIATEKRISYEWRF